jgi:hypothetical protein
MSLSLNVPSCCDNSEENNVTESDDENTIMKGIKIQSNDVEPLFDGSGDVSATKCSITELIRHFSSQNVVDRCI